MIENTGFDAYKIYCVLKLHFTVESYDVIKYNWKTKVTKEQFMLRKDKFFFYKLSRKYKEEELRGFFISNLLIKPKIWVAELLSEDSDSEYKVWMRTHQSLSYVFEQDLIKAFNSVNNPEDLLKVVDSQYPLLYNMYLQEKVHLETIIILNDYMNFLPMWLRKIDDDIIFPEFVKKCGKYRPFIHYDVVKFKGILKGQITESV